MSEPFFEGLSLARPDLRGDDSDLQALVRGAGQSRRAPYEGEDASGSVWVSVSDRARVQSVEISRSWSDRLPPGDVPRALLESYHDATRKAFTAAALTAYENGAAGEARPAPADAPVYRLPPADDDRAWLRSVRDTLEEIEIDRHRRSRGEIGPGPEQTIASPLGCFRARVQGSAVVEITGDPVAIRESSADQLRREALAIFRRAQGDPEDVD